MDNGPNNIVFILDVGAHNGQSIGRLYNAYHQEGRQTVIHSFEPIPENFRLLLETARIFELSHPDCRVMCHNVAVSDEEEVAEFYCYGMHSLESNQYSSLRPFKERDRWLEMLPDQPHKNLQLTKTIEVPTIRLDLFMNKHGIDIVTFLKIDTQGNDYRVLMGLGDLLNPSKIKGVEVECQDIELYEGGSNREELVKLLEGRDYKISRTEYQAHGHEQVIEFVGPRNMLQSLSKTTFRGRSFHRNILSKPKVDVVMPPGQHAWGVREGWVATLKRRGELGFAYMPLKGQELQLIERLRNNAADFILLLGFDHHLYYLHSDEKLRDAWRSLPGVKVLLAQETVLQDCYPKTREMTASAVSCVDLTVFNSAADRPFYEQFEAPSFWQPFAYDEQTFKSFRPLLNRKPRAFFRGKHFPLGGPTTYQRRRELLEFLLARNAVDHLPFDPSLNVSALVEDFNSYQLALNLPAVFNGYTTRVFEAMGTGTCLVTPYVEHPDESTMFESGKHLIFYDPSDTGGLLHLLQSLEKELDRVSAIAEQGLREVQAKHQIHHRWEEILQYPRRLETDSEPMTIGISAAKTPPQEPNDLPVQFFTIVLNGEPFIRHHINQFKKLKFDWHWHIVEGVAEHRHDTAWCQQHGGIISDKLHSNGFSNDGTTDYLDQLVRDYPGKITIYRKPDGQFWDGKLEMVRAPLANIHEECLLWQIDADECWTDKQIADTRTLFKSNPQKTAAYYYCNFYVGPDLVTMTRGTYGNQTGYEWLRTWRYQPGDCWLSHEPPRLFRLKSDGTWHDLAQSAFSHAETERHGLIFEHYAYAIEAQVAFKETYYGYDSAIAGWRRLQEVDVTPVLLRDYFPWVHDGTLVMRKDKSEKSALQRIIWIRSDSIGDNVLASSMLPYIKEAYPTARIGVLCQDHIAELYTSLPFVDSVIGFNRMQAYQDEGYRNLVIRKIRTFHPDLTLNSIYSRDLLSDLFAIGSGAKVTIAFNGNFSNISVEVRDSNNQYYTNIINDNQPYKPELTRHRDFLDAMGIPISAPLVPKVWLSPEDEEFADRFFAEEGLDPQHAICLFAGAQNNVRIFENYGAALARICREQDFSVIAIGGAGDSIINTRNLDAIGVRTIDLSGKTTLMRSAAILKRCRLAVGAETGLAHIACAVGTPNVVLLGGGHFGRFMPYSPLTSVVCLPLECYGCNWQCKYKRVHCVKDISVDVLAEAVHQTLTVTSQKPRVFVQGTSFWKESAPRWQWFNRYLDVNAVEIIPVGSVPEIPAGLEEQYKAAQELAEAEKIEEAAVALEKLLDVYPDFFMAHNDLGVLNTRLGDNEKALQHYKASVAGDSKNILFIKNLADFHYVVRKDVETALPLYSRALALSPDDVEILTMLGNIAIENELFSEAYEFFNKIKKLDPQKNAVDEIIARLSALMQSGTGQTELAAKGEQSTPVCSVSSADQSEYLVTAIVSTYNSERFMRGCLEDLERQTIADKLEIIVVDSGSQQNEERIVREFQEKYNNIRYIRTERCETVYASWNRGIDVARGRYITNANTDDRHKANAFEIMVRFLAEHTDVALVYADVFVTETENEVFEKFTPAGRYTWHDWDRKILLEKGCFMGPQPMWRKSVHDVYGYFDATMVSSGDYEFWLRISQTENFYHIRDFLGLYLKSPGSIEHRNRQAQKRENDKILKEYRDAAEQGVLVRCELLDELKNFLRKNPGVSGTNVMPYIERLDALTGLKKEAVESSGWGSADVLELRNAQEDLDFKRSYQLIRKAIWTGAANDAVLDQLHPVISAIVLSRTGVAVEKRVPLVDVKSGFATIIIRGSEGFHHLVECVKALRNNTKTPCEIVIVAQKGQKEKPGLVKKLSSIMPVTWLDHSGADASATVLNHAMANAKGEFIVLLRDDVMVCKGWLAGMLECRDAVPDAGIVEPVGHHADGEWRVRAVGGKPDRRDDFAARFHETYRNRRIFTDKLEGSCLLFRRDLLERVGFLDEKLGCGRGMIADYALRARLLGYRNVVAGDVFVYRLGEDEPSAPDQSMSFVDRKWNGIKADTPLGRKLIALKAIERATEYHHRGEEDEAVKALLAGMEGAPGDNSIRYALVDLLIENKKFQDALDTLAPLSEDDSRKVVLEGYCREGLKMLDEAEDCANRALALRPAFSQALNLKGVLAYDRGDQAAAERMFREAMAADPSYAEPCSNLGAVLWSAGGHDEGLAFFKRGFMLSPSARDMTNLYFTAAVESGMLNEAETLFRAAKAIYPRNRMITFLLIDILLRAGKNAQAMDEIENAMMAFGMDDGMLEAALAVREKVGPMEVDKKKSGSISLCMIVKDEEKYLAGCLMSAKPVIDEMIVVDTGSTDRTREIARVLGAKVYDFPWTDDFSSARNVSLNHASGRWIFVLDADEVISANDYNLIRKLTAVKKKTVAYSIVTRNYVNEINKTKWIANSGEYPAEERGLGWMPSDKVRLFPNENRVRFVNPVHELVEPSLQKAGIKVMVCPVVVHHYGKLDKEKTFSKGEDYYLLGLKKLAEKGDEVKSLMELAIQAAELKRFSEAIDLWQRALVLHPDILDAYVSMTSIYAQMGLYRDSLAAGKKAIEIDPDSKDAVCNYALSEIYGGDAENAVKILKKLLIKEKNFPQADLLLGIAYFCLGYGEKGEDVFSNMNVTGANLATVVRSFARAMIAAGRPDYTTALLSEAGEKYDLSQR